MSGQFGSDRALLEYETDVDTLFGGIKIHPSDGFELAFDAAWNSTTAAFEPFRFLEGEAFAAMRPHQNYDFSLTHTNSDLDSEFLEAGVRASFEVSSDLSLAASYRYLDFDDNAPYLGDTTGSVDYYGLSLIRKF